MEERGHTHIHTRTHAHTHTHTEDVCIESDSCAKTLSLNEHYKLYCYFNIFSYPITDLTRPLWLQEAEALRISIDGCQSYTPAVFTSSPDDIDGNHFCYSLSLPQSHSAARRIKSM